jgi:enamine deaminase RidA (YjgF/YER057c/UK114 family)
MLGSVTKGKALGEQVETMAGERRVVSSGTKWEEAVGYSRAVRVGNVIEVAGTTAIDETGRIVGAGDCYAQAKFILAKIERALGSAGATLADVVRTRIYVTDISRWREVGRAHGDAFRAIKPVTTMVEVAALIEPGILVEIEATAVVTA